MPETCKYDITVLDIFERTVGKYADKVLIKDLDGEMTYSDVMKKAKLIGYNLLKKTSRLKPVIVFIDKGCDCLCVILGVLYSGNCYVPMDIKTPADRLYSIIDTLQSDTIVASEKSREYLDKIGYAGPVLMFEELAELQADKDAHTRETALSSVRKRIVDSNLMYILFTSGSTGIPKGVAITHRSVVDYIYAFVEVVPITSDDVIGNQVPFYVDMSLKDIYMSIAVGATICVIPQRYFMMPKKVLRYLDDNKVTMLMWVPTAYSIIKQFDGLNKIRPKYLKKFLFSGESMPISVYCYWIQLYPVAVWIQQYGPTEITGACTSFMAKRVYREGETIPIGKPFSNTGLILLDEQDRLIDETMPDTPGEICVYGSCLAAGYYNNPEKTEEAFVQNPLVSAYPSRMYRTGDLAKYDMDGNLVFLSRKDFQIKHGGRRIELGEIETAVDAVPQIKSCCCVHDADNDVIVLFYVGEIEEKELRDSVKNKIPPYMIPGRYIKMSELPRLSNGKLDRKGMRQIAVGQETV